MTQVFDLGNRIEMIDLHDLKMEGRTGSYVIHKEKLTIVETSASPSIPYLLNGLKQMNINPTDIAYIIVTHIHLDHAGGVGLLLEKCPHAKVVVHPRGYRHLVDPTKLIAGAKAVYGADFDDLFHPILPVPEERLIVKQHKDTLRIGKHCELTFYDTPGHAKHHFSIFDPISRGIFTGDTAGVYYPILKDRNIEFYLPSTSPNQYDPDAMLQAIDLYETLDVDRIYFGHFGMSTNPPEVYKQIRAWIPTFIEAGKKACTELETNQLEALTNKTIQHLTEAIHASLKELDIPADHPIYDLLKIDIKICAMGIADYLLKQHS